MAQITRLGVIYGLLFSVAMSYGDLTKVLVRSSVSQDGSATIWLSNLSGVVLEAYQATYTCNDGSGMIVIHDQYYNRNHDQPIAPSGSDSFRLPPHFATCNGGIDAVVFADGTIDGNATEAEHIFARRESLAAELVSLSNLINTSSEDGWSDDELEKRLEAERTSVNTNATFNFSQRTGRLHAVDIAEGNLEVKQSPAADTTGVTPGYPDSHSVPVPPARRAATIRTLKRWADAIHSATSEINRPSF